MKSTVVAILAAGVLIGGAIMLSGGAPGGSEIAQGNNVSVADGKQIVTITAKGRYSPSVTTAKADMPTVLRVETNGTFDCTSALTIPAISYRANLPPTGMTDIELPPQKAGTTLKGICAMGMYNFSVNFN